MAQLMVSKINFFYQRDIHSAGSGFIPCQVVEIWKWLITSMWHLVQVPWEIAVYAYGNASNVEFGEPRCFKEILSTAKKSDKNIPVFELLKFLFFSYCNFSLITVNDGEYGIRVKGRDLVKKDLAEYLMIFEDIKMVPFQICLTVCSIIIQC